MCIICAFGRPERVMKSSVSLQELWSNKMVAVQRRRRKEEEEEEKEEKKRKNKKFIRLCWPTPLKAVEGWWWKILGVSQSESCFYPSVSSCVCPCWNPSKPQNSCLVLFRACLLGVIIAFFSLVTVSSHLLKCEGGGWLNDRVIDKGCL